MEKLEAGKIEELKRFVDRCKSNPSILLNPSLSFFTNYLQSLGAQVPPHPTSEPEEYDIKPNVAGDVKLEDDLVESDIDLDDTDVLPPDNDPPQKMGDPSVEVTDEDRDAAQLSKAKSMDAICEGKLSEALDHLTEAIMLNPTSAILYATRGAVFLKLKKPNAAIRDSNAALKINPDSAKGYKVRGMARAMLGLWEEAASDLHIASKIDFDEEIGTVLKKVEPNVRKIEVHRRKYERLRKERELRNIKREKQQQEAKQASDAMSSLGAGQVVGICNASELETKLNAASKFSRLTIIYFTATWCGPCRYISPEYKKLAEKYTNVVFLKVDIDEAREVAASWNISSVPSFFYIKKGKEVDRILGADRNAVENKIIQYSS